jgi:hypothetical protein
VNARKLINLLRRRQSSPLRLSRTVAAEPRSRN